MKEQTYRYYKDLPPWAKGVVIVGGGLVLALVGIRVYSALFPSEAQKKARELLDKVDQEIKQNENKGLKPSFTESQYVSFANDIYEGMRYAVGDNYGNVERILKMMQNNVDVAKLIKSFGVKQDYAFGIPTGSPKDLITFVNSELGDEYGGLSRRRVDSINKDWRNKGIKYQF